MYKPDFSSDDVGKIRALVARPEFAAERKRDNQWWLAAWQLEQLGGDPRRIGDLYLQASWAEAGKGTSYEEVAGKAHAALLPYAGEAANWLILGELERRLGRFDEAQARFVNLPVGFSQKMVANRWSEQRLNTLVALQLRLIDARDQASHELPSE